MTDLLAGPNTPPEASVPPLTAATRGQKRPRVCRWEHDGSSSMSRTPTERSSTSTSCSHVGSETGKLSRGLGHDGALWHSPRRTPARYRVDLQSLPLSGVRIPQPCRHVAALVSSCPFSSGSRSGCSNCGVPIDVPWAQHIGQPELDCRARHAGLEYWGLRSGPQGQRQSLWRHCLLSGLRTPRGGGRLAP